MRSFRPGFIVVGIKMRAFKRGGGEGGEREREIHRGCLAFRVSVKTGERIGEGEDV